MSANPSAQPRPTGDIRPISGGAGTDRPTQHGHEYTHSYRYAPCRHKACGTLRPSPARARRSPWDPYGRRVPPPAPRQVREAQSAPRTGPPPAGNEATVFPQPAVSSTAGRPTQHPCKRSRGDRARAHGRAHGHTPGARADTPDEGPGEGAGGRTGRAPDAPRRAGPGWSAGNRWAGTACPRPLPEPRPRPRPLHPGAAPLRSPRRGAAELHRPSSAPPRSLRGSSALPSRGVRLPLAHPASPVTRAARLPGVPRAWPVRTTIPPYGRPALNGRDAANYAGFTDVLSRAAYSSGLGQMRVRPECRGPSLGRTRYECRAPHR